MTYSDSENEEPVSEHDWQAEVEASRIAHLNEHLAVDQWSEATSDEEPLPATRDGIGSSHTTADEAPRSIDDSTVIPPWNAKLANSK